MAAVVPSSAAISCDALFQSIKIGSIFLKHRISMSGLTRLRCDPTTEAPREINALYYEQRASDGGLIVTEGTSPCPTGKGYVRAPNMYDEAHVIGWREVLRRVHGKGGFIFSQLMHAGRVSHSSLLPGGGLPVAPSAVQMQGQVHTRTGKLPYEVPRALETSEIPGVIGEIKEAAKLAIATGFDGIELHGGNGYLLQEFMAAKTNLRTDAYGGSVENRCRFVLELIDACIEAIGADKVGIKLQQGVSFSDLIETEEDSKAQLAYLGPELAKRKLAYVCLSSLNYEPYYKFVGLEKPNFEVDIWKFFREYYPAPAPLMMNGGLSPEKAAAYIADGTVDLASFGVPFIANANLPALIKAGKELNQGGWDMSVWYSRDPANDAKGYTDWPLVEA